MILAVTLVAVVQVILDYGYDTSIDLWSLGCILYELYTGDVLFRNESIQTMLTRMIGLKGGLLIAVLGHGGGVGDSIR